MIKLKDYDVRLLDRVSKKLSSQIDINEIDNEFYVKNDDLLSVIDELYDEVGHLEERIEDIEQDMQENYTPKKIDEYDFYGVSRNDFI